METITLEKDIPLICLKADSFPEGVLAAHQSLHRLVPFSRERSYFGLSRFEGRSIVYYAAAEQLHPEEGHGLERSMLKAGAYLGSFIPDFRSDIPAIGRGFQELMRQPGIDPDGWCVEWYGEDGRNVTCLARLKNN